MCEVKDLANARRKNSLVLALCANPDAKPCTLHVLEPASKLCYELEFFFFEFQKRILRTPLA